MRRIGHAITTLSLSVGLLTGLPVYGHADTFTQTQAVSLNTGSETSDTLSSKSDIKYYKISTAKDAMVYLALENVSAPIQAQLLDQNGSQMAYLNTYFDKSKAIEVKVPQGTYYIRVQSSNWASSVNTGTYTIKATYTVNQDVQNSDQQLNETIDNAVLLKSGSAYQAKLTSSVDINYYKVLQKEAGSIYVRLENLSAPVQAQLLDENGNSVTNLNTYSAKNNAIEAKVNSGTYYIKVAASTWDPSVTSGTYSIRAAYVTIPIVHDDNYEPNDTIENAYRIHAGNQYNSKLTSNVDRNYFKVQLDYGGQLSIDLQNADHPIVAQLVDADGNSLAYIYPGASAASKILLNKGIYYVKVSPVQWDDSTTGNYSITATFPEDNNISVKVNGIPLSLSQAPVIENGRTLVPLRGVLESLGAAVSWDDASQTVTVNKDGTTVGIPIGSQTASINGKSVQLDAPAMILNGRTMVPIRFVSESVNAKVGWDEENQTVNITI